LSKNGCFTGTSRKYDSENESILSSNHTNSEDPENPDEDEEDEVEDHHWEASDNGQDYMADDTLDYYQESQVEPYEQAHLFQGNKEDEYNKGC
ncbi:hypothetical protein C0995_009552, partial [Termitomyces sp. Mi166